MNKLTTKKIILIIVLVVGLLLVGIGFGVAVGEITNVSYAGDREIFGEKVKTETIPLEVPVPTDGKLIKLPKSVYHYFDNKNLKITPDESLPIGRIDYEIKFNTQNIDFIDIHFDDFLSENEEVDAEAYIEYDFEEEPTEDIEYVCSSIAKDEISSIINSYIDNYDIDGLKQFIDSDEIQNIINNNLYSDINNIVNQKVEIQLKKNQQNKIIEQQKKKKEKYLGEVKLNVYNRYNKDLEIFLEIIKAIKNDLKENKIGNYSIKNDVPEVLKISVNPKMIEYLELM